MDFAFSLTKSLKKRYNSFGGKMFSKRQIVRCEVTGYASYGVFVKVKDYIGLIHISEISDKFVQDIYFFASIGDFVDALILEIDEENKQLKLSYKQAENKKKIIVRDLEIGFKTLEDEMPFFLKRALRNIKDDNDD